MTETIVEQRTILDRFADFIVRFVPDAITASVVLLLALAAFALALGNTPIQLADAYYKGFWSLLPFTSQMAISIVLGGALAATPWFQRLLGWLSGFPKTSNQIVALGVLLAAICSYFFWGLGLALCPMIAVHFARAAGRKGIAIHFPFFLAAVYASLAVWQFGPVGFESLAGGNSGPFSRSMTGVIPLSRTIWSPAANLDVVLYIAAINRAGCLLMPKASRPLSDYPGALQLAEPIAVPPVEAKTFSERLETKPYFAWMLCAVFLMWLWYHFFAKSAGANINSMNITLLFLTFLLHGNVKSVTRAFESAIVSAWPILILYPLYAGLSGLIEFTSIGGTLAALVSASSNSMTYPTLSAAVGTVFSFFIPSSGGQWVIQGLVTVKSAVAVGVSVERGILSLAIGDHMGNLISPFWYVIIAGMARIDFRTFFGYGLSFAAIWLLSGLLFLHCAVLTAA